MKYYIFQIGRVKDNGKIACYRIGVHCQSNSQCEKLENPTWIGRPTLIKALQERKPIRTATIQRIEAWTSEVCFTLYDADVRVNSNGFIRTDSNDTTEDNLGNLTEVDCGKLSDDLPECSNESAFR